MRPIAAIVLVLALVTCTCISVCSLRYDLEVSNQFPCPLQVWYVGREHEHLIGTVEGGHTRRFRRAVARFGPRDHGRRLEFRTSEGAVARSLMASTLGGFITRRNGGWHVWVAPVGPPAPG